MRGVTKAVTMAWWTILSSCLVLSNFYAAAQTTPEPCPVGYETGYNEQCYFILEGGSENYTSWQVTREICRQGDVNSDLLMINNNDELQYIKGRIASLTSDVWWIGYSDLSDEGNWKWLDCNKSTTWQESLWVTQGSEDCAGYQRTTSKIADYNCNSLQAYICEISPKGFTVDDTNVQKVDAVAVNRTAIHVHWEVSPYNCDITGYTVLYQQYSDTNINGSIHVSGGNASKVVLTNLATDVMWKVFVAAIHSLGGELDFIGPAQVWLGSCPEWHLPGFNGTCYWFYYTPNGENWFSYERSSCLDRGSELLIISSQEELDYILNQTESLAPGQEWWIGYSDVTVEGTWRWMDCSSTDDWQSTLWAPGEPAEVEDCATLKGDSGHINGHRCDEKFFFICEVTPKDFTVVDTNARNVKAVATNETTIQVTWEVSPYNCDIIGYRVYYQHNQEPNDAGWVQVYNGGASNVTLYSLTTNSRWEIYVAALQIVQELDRVGPVNVWLGSCPEWHLPGPNGSCYWFYHDVNDTSWWIYRRGACQDRGSDLLIINSQEELNYILNHTETLAPGQTWWIGYYDVSVEGTWRWVDCSDTSDWQSTLWVPGEPAQRKDCGILLGGTGQLSSEVCDEKFNFICEVSPKGSVQVYDGNATEVILSSLTTNVWWQIYVAGMNIEQELDKVGPAEIWLGPCPGWHLPGPNGSCYWFYHNVNNTGWWYSRRNSCRNQGSDLLIIDNQEELDYILNQTETLAPGQTWWIGYYDVSVEGTWRWVDCSDTSDWQSTLWVPGEPAQRKDCGILLGGTGQLSSEVCDEKFNFICEVSPKDFTEEETKPTKVVAVAMTPTSVQVTWVVSVYSCDIIGYRVHYFQTSNKDLKDSVTIYGGDANMTLLTDLEIDTEYSIGVAALNTREELEQVGPVIVTTPWGCPEDFEEGPGERSCFAFYNDYGSWDVARRTCGDVKNGDLAIIDSPQELEFIQKRMEEVNPGQMWWLGYSDISVEGDWRWVDCQPTADWQQSLWPSDEPRFSVNDCGYIQKVGSAMEIRSVVCDDRMYILCEITDKGFIPEDGNARNVRVSPLTPASFEVKWDGSPTSCDVIGYSIYYSKENTSSSEEFTTVYGGDIRTAKIDVTAVTQDTVYLVYVAGLNWLSVLDRIGPARVTLTPESDNREYISVTGDSGDIQSPGWPTSYENNKDITWTITVSKPGRVRLTILSIRLDSNGDYLTVGSGGTSGLNELGRYTGYQENVGYLESQFNQMWLRFITDSTKTAQGFSVEFAKVDDGTVDDCGRSFTDIASGFINSPNYLEGTPYPNNLDCVWKIKLQDQTALVKLDFINFDVERDHDFLIIGSGLTVNENILKWMTGKLDPPISSIVSPTNEMWLRFLSDESQGSRGFRAEFTSQEGSPPTTPVYETADTLLFIVKNENVAWFDAVNQVQLKSTIAEVLNRYEIPAQQEIKQKIQGNFDASDVVFVRFYDVDSDLHIVTWVHDASSIDPKVPLNPEMVIQAVTAEKEYFQSSMGESFEYEMRLPTTPVPTVPTSSLPDWAIAVIAVGSLSILIVLGLFIFGCSKIGGDHSSLKKEVQIQLGDENGSFRPTSFGSDGTWNPAFHSIMDESEELASDTGL
ncbi:uncharacterized protein LOC110985794 isoform X3 [Acanthaster planci]|uniref:Uncharacterized protein LOC110985794 isoform X3 n=1 Tax=Acanthaster planci TaxID=133434 RepID=A0A8B7ZAW4_ACAPL|nr:uncharacterized protein LOC110985794 isoform X3 [Acanthaster planci]